MIKKCPECSKENDQQAKECKACDFSFENTSQEKQDKKNQHIVDEHEEKNENIEWSELKDLSLGHVMTLFNKQHQGEVASEEETGDSEATDGEIQLDDHLLSDLVSELRGQSPSEPEKFSTNKEKEAQTALDQYLENHKPEIMTTNDEKLTIEDLKESEEDIAETSPKKELVDQKTESKPAQDQPELASEQEIVLVKKEPLKNKDEELSETKIFEIPSKSKKPEEIEMDAAPIFFEEDSVKTKTPNYDKQPVSFTRHEHQQLTSKPENIKPNQDKKDPRRRIYIGLALFLLVIGSIFLAIQQFQKMNTTKEDNTVISAEKEEIQRIESDINSYYTNNEHLYIKPTMVNVSTKTIKSSLQQIKSNKIYPELATLLEKLEEKLQLIQKVNGLFLQPVVVGDQLVTGQLAQDRAITINKTMGSDGFEKLINQALKQADDQYQQLQKAKDAVLIVFKDGYLPYEATRENYDMARQDVNTVINPALKKPLEEQLNEADKQLTAKETPNIQGIVSGSGGNVDVTQETVSQNPVNNNISDAQFSPPNSNGVYTDPVYLPNPTDTADMSNPAWLWNPGVLEQVLSIAMQRGYVVEGGYYLEPARIINGEGFYNLYATKKSQLLPNFAEGDTPVYIITINDKTGWFKGNASRNAGR